ncbi:MAG: hypothetical protein GYB33_11200 [Gammaproteobacteria bacterium]|nr:hypothetical protein [Gammaproteobacteria bacterium]
MSTNRDVSKVETSFLSKLKSSFADKKDMIDSWLARNYKLRQAIRFINVAVLGPLLAVFFFVSLPGNILSLVDRSVGIFEISFELSDLFKSFIQFYRDTIDQFLISIPGVSYIPGWLRDLITVVFLAYGAAKRVEWLMNLSIEVRCWFIKRKPRSAIPGLVELARDMREDPYHEDAHKALIRVLRQYPNRVNELLAGFERRDILMNLMLEHHKGVRKPPNFSIVSTGGMSNFSLQFISDPCEEDISHAKDVFSAIENSDLLIRAAYLKNPEIVNVLITRYSKARNFFNAFMLTALVLVLVYIINILILVDHSGS